MSTRTIYTCDRCKAEQQTLEQFWTIGVTANHGTYSGTHYIGDLSMQVCRKCLDAMGVLVKEKEKPSPTGEPYPSLEDLIREIARQEVHHA